MMEVVRRRQRRASQAAHHALSTRCRAFAEAIIGGRAEPDAAAEVGARYAADGEGLDLCLADLDEVYRAVDGETTPPAVLRAASLAWAEAMQQHYNCLTCADPLTGLTSIQHLQSSIGALFEAARAGHLVDADVTASHVLVVVELAPARPRTRAFEELEVALRHAAAAEVVREVLPHAGDPARLNPQRIAFVAGRTDGLDARVTRLAETLELRLILSPSGGAVRAWVEALPADPHHARRLVDELAR